ncbi:Adrenodoxin-like protein 2 [Citrus sinensis]|nr:Adrenodoxin-like protein 2 [Citrus sinensis]
MVKELSRGASCTYISRTGCTSQHWRPLIKLQSDPRVFQGSLFQKYPQFSTTAENNASHGSSIQKDILLCRINVTFVDKDIEEKNIKVPVGVSMLEVAHENDIELEGACEGSLACSTCHVIVMDMDYYNKLQDPTDEEMTCWILLLGLQRRKSHLGCQIVARPELDGICLALPAASRNFAVDGFVPKPR